MRFLTKLWWLTIAVMVGGTNGQSWADEQTFITDYNTDTMVSAELPYEMAIQMFDAMDEASGMSVAVGKAKPFQVSLVGSTRATNAFRTCARINSNSKVPGSNPFD